MRIIVGQGPAGSNHDPPGGWAFYRIVGAVGFDRQDESIEIYVGVPVVVPTSCRDQGTVFWPGIALLVIDLETDLLAQRGSVKYRFVADPKVEIGLADAPSRHAKPTAAVRSRGGVLSNATGAGFTARAFVMAMIHIASGQDSAVAIP